MTEADFLEVEQQAARIGAVKSFENFIHDIPAAIDLGEYGTVLVWCETFSEFISAAAYR